MNAQKVIIIPKNELDEKLKGLKEILALILTKIDNSDNISKEKDPFLTRKQTASLLKISLPTLTSYVKKGHIPVHRIGSRVLFEKNEVLKAINKIQITK